MQSAAWIQLLQRIPRAQQDNLMLLTTVGIEIAVQQIVRAEEEYVVIRGRLSGSSDSGRAFFIPYDQINYVGFQRPVSEAALFTLLDGVAPSAVEAPPQEPPSPEPELASEEPPSPEPAADMPPAEPAKPEAKPVMANKAALLDKLRARSRAGETRPGSK